MKKNNLLLFLPLASLLLSCGDNNKTIVVREKWNNDEATKINSLMFENASNLIPCYVFNDVTITEFTKDAPNFKKGIEVSSKGAALKDLKFEDALFSKNFKKEGDAYKLVIEENKYLECSSTLLNDVFKYNVSYFEEIKEPIPEKIRKEWKEDEVSLINNAFNGEYASYMPCYALEDSKLTNEVSEYGDVSLYNESGTEEDLSSYIKDLEKLKFEYNVSGDFYFKFINSEKSKYVGIKPYLDPIENLGFYIDYYLTEIPTSKEYIEEWNYDDVDLINSGFAISLENEIPCLVTEDYYINPSDMENYISIGTKCDMSLLDSYINKFIINGYIKLEEEGEVYVEKQIALGKINAFFTYDVSGYLEIYVYFFENEVSGLRTERTADEEQAINNLFGDALLPYIPCIIPIDGTVDVKDEKIIIKGSTLNEETLNSAKSILNSTGYFENLDTGIYEYELVNKGTINISLVNEGSFILEISFVSKVTSQDDVTGDITILASEFSHDYPKTEEAKIIISNMDCTISSIKQTDGTIQFRNASKGAGYILNDLELPSIKSITAKRKYKDFEAADNEELSLYKSDDGLKYTKVERDENFVYNLDNAKYFKIINETSYALYLESIIIDFIDL